ncbi:MAG: helix-turn-helix domain-containing protein [Chloroflexota bacterium]
MSRIYEERLSDSSFVDKVGHFYVESDCSYTCGAGLLWNMLIVTYKGQRSVTIWRPETQSGLMNFPAGAEFLFIHFKLGRFMPQMSLNSIGPRGILLPKASSQSFWLDSSAWQLPNYQNADTFVDWLVRDGLLVHEPIVDAVLQNQPQDIPPRTLRHRFLRATGLTQSYIYQLERARQAATLLEKGVSILDTVDQAGYADQPHLTRALKRFIGTTPAQITSVIQP